MSLSASFAWNVNATGVGEGPGLSVGSGPGHGLACRSGGLGWGPGGTAVVTHSVPWKQSKKSSKLRFSCTMITICWILLDLAESRGTTPAVPGPFSDPEHAAIAKAIANTSGIP